MEFGPQKIDIKEVGINSLWAIISWVIWSIVMLILILSFSKVLNISDTFMMQRSSAWDKDIMFPVILSIIAFIATSISIFLTYIFLNFANPERYKKNKIIFGQIAFSTIFIYFFMAFAYIYAGNINYDYIMIIFLIHNILAVFLISLVIEVLNNYRYILVSIYASFLWLFASMIISSLIFWNIDSGQTKLISLLFLLPIINFSQVFFKWLFDFIYYKYNILTGQDQIWDIFYQIELEEKEALKEEEEKNTI